MADTIVISGGTYTVDADEDLSFENASAVEVNGDAPSTLISFGKIAVTQDPGTGMAAFGLYQDSSAALTVSLRASSEFTVTGTNGTVGFSLGASGSRIANAGLLAVHGGDGETLVVAGRSVLEGVRFSNTGGVQADTAGALDAFNLGLDSSFTNRGDVTLSGGGETDSSGVEASNFVNHGSFSIRGFAVIGVQTSDFTNTGDLLASGIYQAQAMVGAGSIHNSGRIIAEGNATGVDDIALKLTGASDIENSGVIRAEVAIDATGFSGEVSLDNSGRIYGDIVLSSVSPMALSNTGKIFGDIVLGNGDDVYDGAGGKLHGEIFGASGDDMLTGGKGADVLDGGSGRDFLSGGRGADSLYGGDSYDTLMGGAGADLLDAGRDRAVADTFLFTRLSDSRLGAMDIIVRLEKIDLIDLQKIDADATRAGNQAFHLVSALDGHAGELALGYDAGADVTTLAADVDGDGAADFAVAIQGDASDFDNFVL